MLSADRVPRLRVNASVQLAQTGMRQPQWCRRFMDRDVPRATRHAF